jgi:hypothetical protein
MDAERPKHGPAWLPIAAFAAAVVLGGAFAAHTGFFNDDALITVRYAENLARGIGLVYNPGEQMLGTTTPLWALVLGAVAWSGRSAPAAATWLGVAAFGWTAAATVLVFRRRGAEAWLQCAAAGLVVTCGTLLLWAGSGMETSAYVATLATLVLLFEAERPVAFGFFAGVLVLLRIDGGLVLAAAAVIDVVRRKSATNVLRALPAFALVVVPWIVGATWFYGTPLSNSGFAKRLQVEDWGPFAPRYMEDLLQRGMLLPFALVGMAAALRKSEHALPAAAFGALTAGFALGGFPGCGWYYAAPTFLLVLCAADGLGHVVRALSGGTAPLRSPLALAAIAGAFVGTVRLPRDAHDQRVAQTHMERCHAKVGDWLREHAPPGASVAVDNIGYIGYRSQLRVVDMLGLIQPETVTHLAAGERDWAIRSQEPEFIAVWLRRGNSYKYLPPADWLDRRGYRIVYEAPVFPEYPQGQAYGVYSRMPLFPDPGGPR